MSPQLNMESAKYNQLTASALRIYLTYVLNEMEGWLQNFSLRLRIATSQEERADWDNVVTFARQVISNVKKCQREEGSRSFFSRGLHGLCAIEAAQDALASALCHTQSYFPGSASRCNHFGYLSDENSNRAKCLVNAIECMGRNDQKGASLWEQAAHHVLRQSQLRRTDVEGKSIVPAFISMQTPSLPAFVDVVKDDDMVVELKALAVHNSNLNAAYLVMGRQTDYHLAAAIYEKASDLRMKNCQGPPYTQKLWARAVSTMRLAAEMIEVQAVNCTAQEDPLVGRKIVLAYSFAEDAAEVMRLTGSLDALRHKYMHTLALVAKCEVSCALPVFKLLQAAQQQVLQKGEKYLETVQNSEKRSEYGSRQLQQFTEAKSQLEPLTVVGDELETGIERYHFYRAEYEKRFQVWDSKLRCLARLCWAQAAEREYIAIEWSASVVKYGVYQPISPNALSLCNSNMLVARMYATCVNTIVNTALRYQSYARGAEHSQRDAREAQWWREAAEMQTLAAVHFFSEVQSIDHSQMTDAEVPLLFTCVAPFLDQSYVFTTAADYLRRSFAFKTDQRAEPHALRVAELYSRAAEWTVSQDSAFGARAVPFCLILIDCFTSATTDINQEAMVICDQVYLTAQCAVPQLCTNLWRKAFEACVTASELVVTQSIARARLAAAGAALFAQAAKAVQSQHCSAYELCADQLASPGEHELATSYFVVLAQRVLTVQQLDIPAELRVLQCIISVAQATVLEQHVDACNTLLDCNLQEFLAFEGSDERARWSEARQAAEDLTASYTTYVHSLYTPSTGADHSAELRKCAYHKVTTRCFATAAQCPSPVWTNSLTMCREPPGQWYVEATRAIERYVCAAEAMAAQDTKLAVLWTNAALASRELFLCLRCERWDMSEMLCFLSKEADLRVLMLLAQRKEDAKLLLLCNNMATLLGALKASCIPHWSVARSNGKWASEPTKRQKCAFLQASGRLRCEMHDLIATDNLPLFFSEDAIVSVPVPFIGTNLHSCEIVGCNCKVGDVVEAGKLLAVVETDKVTECAYAPYNGRIIKIYAKEGDGVTTGQPLMDIEAF